MNSRITTLDALADGTLTLSEAAARLQASEAQVQEWAQLVIIGQIDLVYLRALKKFFNV